MTSVAVLALTVVKRCFRDTVVTGRGLETEFHIYLIAHLATEALTEDHGDVSYLHRDDCHISYRSR